MLSSQTE